MKSQRRPVIILLLLALCCISLITIPLFSPYLIGTADGMAHKYRLVSFHASLTEGILRPRWSGLSILSYGIPLFLFNYSVPYYIVDGLLRIVHSIQLASQWYAALTILGSWIAMALATAAPLGPVSAITAATVYVLAPYHLLTIYSYEAWGEMLAFVLVPLTLFFLVRAIEKKTPLNRAIASITWAILFWTHNISSWMTFPALFILSLLLSKHGLKGIRTLVHITAQSLLLAAFFLIPSFATVNTITILRLLEKEIALRTLYMVPFLSHIQTSFAALNGMHIEYRAFTIGMPILFSLIIGVGEIFRKRTALLLTLIAILLGSLMLMDPVASPFYVFRPLQFVLYPYRFLFIATFAGAILAGYIVRRSFFASLFLCILTLLFGYPFSRPYLELFPFPDTYFYQPQLMGYAVPTLKTMGGSEFLPTTASVPFLVSEEKRSLDKGIIPEKIMISHGSIIAKTVKQESLRATVAASGPATVTISTLFYPTWRATVDSSPIPLSPDAVGRITLPVSTGTHTISIWLGYGPYEIAGILMSILGGMVMVASFFV